jgi:predicted nucleotidyltransferase
MARFDPARLLAAITACPVLRGHELIAVWLFGSERRGSAHRDSDLDLGVLCSPPLGLDATALGDQLGRSLGCDVDAIDMASVSATLAWEIITSGRLICERDEREVEDFVRRTRFAEEDESQRNRMIVLAQSPRVGTQNR